MADRKHPYRFSEEIRRLDGEKSGLLFYARERAAANDLIESARAFAKAARMEEEIATRLEAEGYPQEAMISWVSAASCYNLAYDFAEALRVCELVEEKPFRERYQDIFQQIETNCKIQMAKPIVIAGDSGHIDFQPGTRVIFGENTLEQLGDLTKELGGRRVLIVTDPGIVRAGILERALHSLKKESLDAFVFDGVEENPTTRHVEAGVRFAQEQGQIDLIIGLGGGSALDCAKGVNFILTNGGVMEDYWGVDKATQPMLPSIGIPTTAGTGSEAQSFALIAQEKTHIKMACGDKKARFRTVILDPVLTQSTPKGVTAATGIDAIAHAVESYVTTRRNPISQMFAREAWRLLEGSFETVLSYPEDIEARSRMLLGAHLAGAAIENSMLGAAHACANPLTARYGITHGIAVGLMLPHVIRFNSEVIGDLYRELHPALSNRIVELQTTANLPHHLRDLGIDPNALLQLAKEAMTQWTGRFNPRPVGETELLELYEMAY